MFTGIIEESATIKNFAKTGTGARIAVLSKICASDANVGDSICVNGICLTGLLIDQKDAASTDKAVEAMGRLLAQCREFDGNLVIQSAPADIKGKLKMWGEIGSDFVVMKRLKDQLDPTGIMSPGRFVGGL